MTEEIVCPAYGCSFSDSISEVENHIQADQKQNHHWDQLGFNSSSEFRYESHLNCADELKKQGERASLVGNYENAIESLEEALWHYQQAELNAEDRDCSFTEKCKEVLEKISDTEHAERLHVIDELVDQAENAVDEGNQFLLASNISAAATAYEESIKLLEKTLSNAESTAPDKAEDIRHRLQRAQLYAQSLKSSQQHRKLSELITEAREYSSAGDRAFKQSDFEAAIEEYETASDCYDSLVESIQEFDFDEPTDDSTECDVCHERFDQALTFWELDLDERLEVCPPCARFGPQGVLPTPNEIKSEHQTIKENIESLREGDTGLDWFSSSSFKSADREGEAQRAPERNISKMLIQLTGLVQTVGRIPTTEEVDEETDFAAAAYQDEFGSVLEALRSWFRCVVISTNASSVRIPKEALMSSNIQTVVALP